MSNSLSLSVPTIKKAPNPIDKHVGARVRMRRILIGMSQEKLGDALSLTFQQVQKYEKGTNRIGASRLQQIGAILGVPVEFFFDGAPSGDGTSGTNSAGGFRDSANPQYVTDFLATSEGVHLNRSFIKIKDQKIRRRIIELVDSLADNDLAV
jgi:transcriptional regulator with XRE-family HTH domain